MGVFFLLILLPLDTSKGKLLRKLFYWFLLFPTSSEKKYTMLNLNTKTLWMCKLQNSKPFSLCQCKLPKVQRIKYTLSCLTMIEHVPVLLKSAAGSLSNPPKAERGFFKWAWEKESDPHPNLSLSPLAPSFENSRLAVSNHLTQGHGAGKSKTYLCSVKCSIFQKFLRKLHGNFNKHFCSAHWGLSIPPTHFWSYCINV